MEKSSAKAIYVGKKNLSSGDSNPHQYAEATDLYNLLSEVTKIYLRRANVAPNQTLSQFLQQCNKGEHVLLKSYNSFHKQALCKMCFLFNFNKIFEVQSHIRNGLDYYQLFRLLCSDFPKQIIMKSISLVIGTEGQTKAEHYASMYKQISSKKIITALFLNIIYNDYLDNILTTVFANNVEVEKSLLEVYQFLIDYDLKTIRQNEKPPFHIIFQILLNLLHEKGAITQQSPLVFLTEQNMSQFVRECSPSTCTYLQLFGRLIQDTNFGELVEQNLGMFENSTTWATEQHKILSLRQQHQTPLNVKKKSQNPKK